jgi:hypothetical protein
MRASSGGPLSLVCGPAPQSTLGVSLLSSPSNNSRSQNEGLLAGNNTEQKLKSDVDAFPVETWFICLASVRYATKEQDEE